MRRHELSDDQWETIRATLPSGAGRRSSRGYKNFINAVVWIAKTGAPCRERPKSGTPPRSPSRALRDQKARIWPALRCMAHLARATCRQESTDRHSPSPNRTEVGGCVSRETSNGWQIEKTPTQELAPAAKATERDMPCRTLARTRVADHRPVDRVRELALEFVFTCGPTRLDLNGDKLCREHSLGRLSSEAPRCLHADATAGERVLVTPGSQAIRSASAYSGDGGQPIQPMPGSRSVSMPDSHSG